LEESGHDLCEGTIKSSTGGTKMNHRNLRWDSNWVHCKIQVKKHNHFTSMLGAKFQAHFTVA